MELIVLSIPIFFTLMGIELLINYLKKKDYYRLNDSVTNISCGIGQQVVGLFIKFLTITIYFYVFRSWKILDIPNTWLTYALLFISIDFIYYWFHRLSHEVNFLWAGHIVHHQSEEYNLSVALRQSWIQNAFSAFFYLPLAFMGFTPEMFLTMSALNTLYQFWIHTKFINKLPFGLEYILMTPSHHRVHHGTNPKYIDKNHGATFIIWDKLFGTFQAEEEEVVYGITTPVNSWNPVWVNLHYWVDLFKSASHTSRFIDKIKVFLMPPGWFPKNLGGFKPAPEITPDRLVKYDEGVYKSLGIYVLVQFIICLGYTSYFLNVTSTMNQIQIIGFSIFIMLTLLVMGGIFEKQKWAMALEYIRLVSSLLLIAMLVDFNFASLPLWLVPLLGIIIFGSLLWYSSQIKWFKQNDRKIPTGIKA
jgi:sterol desaturase/sphingolipid hydroxylase (fatty acid hydroxylase superfamily)